MAILCWDGTPGSGKSFHMAKMLLGKFKTKTNIIVNFPMNQKMVDKAKLKQKKGDVIYKDNSDLTVSFLVRYALSNHKLGVENQGIIVFDEAQIIFNSRNMDRNERARWISFFTQHRKFGYNIYLVCQSMRMIDRQIRDLVETETTHRKINNNGFGGMLLTLFTWHSFFMAIEKWCGGNGVIVSKDFFVYSKRISKIYDSYHLFDDFGLKDFEDLICAPVVSDGMSLATGTFRKRTEHK